MYCKNSSRTYYGTVKPSCEGYITFDNKEQKTFEFVERDKEIVWSGPDAGKKWIRGCLYWIKFNLHICFHWQSQARWFNQHHSFFFLYKSRYSRVDQVKYLEDSLSRPYHFKLFKGFLPQILLCPFLNTLTHITHVFSQKKFQRFFHRSDSTITKQKNYFENHLEMLKKQDQSHTKI